MLTKNDNKKGKKNNLKTESRSECEIITNNRF